MIFLPLGIKNFLEERALSRAANYGLYLIELVCKAAWDMGFKCDHPATYRYFDKKNKVNRCKVCGMHFQRERDQSWTCLGYPHIKYINE